VTGKKDDKRTLAGKCRSSFVFEELEPRLLLSADLPIDLPAVLAADRGDDEPIAVHEEITATAVTGEQYASRELVFVDTDTPDYQLLVDDLLSNSNEERQIEVILLDNSSDGIAQITQTLSDYSELDAVHIISHGREGSIDLGGARLEFDTLLANRTAIQAWGGALSENGDFLIYGCNLAANADGQSLVNALGRLTGADVAASDDLTGNVALGGDWDLEYRSGVVETSIAFSANLQQHWLGQLASPAGSEFLVNSTISGIQETHSRSLDAVAADASGNFVVVFTATDVDGTGVFAQRYNAAGVAQGSEFRVNSTIANEQNHASVAMDDAGNFVVTWVGEAQDADSSNQYNIYAQRYSAAGVAQGGEFRVNTNQVGDQLYPAVAMTASGSFVISWTGPSANGNDILAQRYNAAGVAQGGEFRVNSYTINAQQYSSVAMDDAGNFVVTWTSKNQDANLGDVYAQRYNAAGVAQGSEFRVNTEQFKDQTWSTVTMDASANFVITWTSLGQDGDASGDGNIYAQRYNAGGVAQGGEFRINGTTAGDQSDARVAMDAAGNFTVTWMSFGQDGDSSAQSNIYAREYDATGSALGSEFRVNTTTSASQRFSSVVRAATDDYIIVWSGNGTGDSDGVFGQRYDVNNAPTLGNGTLASVAEDTASPDGQTVSAIFSGQFADIDSGASFAGIALVGNTANAGTQGVWQYSTNAGANWFAIGPVADGGTALAVSSSTLIRFVPVANYNGTPPSLVVRGLDNTYAGGFSTTAGSETRVTVNTTTNGGITAIAAATANLSTTITPVNGAPVAVADSITVNEGSTTRINLATNDSDTDDGLDLASITIVSDPTNGALAVNADGTVDYSHDGSEIVADSFTYTIDDLAGATSNTVTVNLTMTPVNDAPIHSVPAAQSTSGNTPLIFSSLNGNGITVTDPDASGSSLEVTLSVSNGTLSLAGTSGLSFIVGDGSGDTTMTFTGTAAEINAAMNGLTFQADEDYEGMATVQIITDDLGNVGTGGALNALDRVNITVTASAQTGIAQDKLLTLDELMLENMPDLPTPVLAPVNTSNIDPATPASGSGTTPASDPAVDAIPESGRGVATQADGSIPGAVPLFDQNLQPYDDDKPTSVQLIHHVTRQGLMDPFAYAKMLNPLQPDAAIWESIEAMMEQMDGRDTSWYRDDQVLTTTTATGLTVSFTVSYLSWLLRAGYLSASLLSTLPLWREFDPLPVLATTMDNKHKSADRDKDSPEMNDIESESIFASSETA